MPIHQRNTSTSSSKGNIFSAIRRNQELEREKRLAQRVSFIDPAIEQVQGGRRISILQAIQLSKPVSVQSQIARPPTQRQQVATTNISPQAKNALDLSRAFPPSVSQIVKPTGERQNLVQTGFGTGRTTTPNFIQAFRFFIEDLIK